MDAEDKADLYVADSTDMKRDIEAVIKKYPMISVYTVIGAIEVVKANLLESLGRPQ